LQYGETPETRNQTKPLFQVKEIYCQGEQGYGQNRKPYIYPLVLVGQDSVVPASLPESLEQGSKDPGAVDGKKRPAQKKRDKGRK